MSMLPKQNPARKVPYTESPTVDRIRDVDYGLALWVPTADKVKDIINAALEKKTPFACLVPSCLVNLIPTPEHRDAMDKTIKIVLLQPELTWVVYNIEAIHRHQVFPAVQERNTFTNLTDFRGIVRDTPDWDLRDWTPGQIQLISDNPQLYPPDKICTRSSDGFKLFKPDADSIMAIVPPDYVKELVLWQHQRLCHAGAAKVYSMLKKHWHWPTMQTDIRKIVDDCAPCQLLKAKRIRAHHHFRAKVFCTPRTSWGCDFYGLAESKKKYNNILGFIDLSTSECRLFACKNRSASTVAECLLDGIILRDGCPLHLHSDAAREFISKAVKRLCVIIGCRQTTTLAHHPTGNSAIERLWQWVAQCIKLMTTEQYQEWENYVRLMEHAWNTTFHSVLKCTPFEAAHGLPARSAIDSVFDIYGLGTQPVEPMSPEGVAAMRTTAEAFVEQVKNVRREAAEKNADMNKGGLKRSFKVGDKVSFFIPPTAKEAQAMGRKAKHLLFYKGPAIIVQRLSNSTYELDYQGLTYYRCFSELRAYKSSKTPLDLPIANDQQMQLRKLIMGKYVALCDSAEPTDDRFYLCRVIAFEDNNVILLNYATWNKNIRNAKFSVLYSDDQGRYTTDVPRRNARNKEVTDTISLDEADDLIDHYDIKMTKSMNISAKSRRQLQQLGLRHHILGTTFP